MVDLRLSAGPFIIFARFSASLQISRFGLFYQQFLIRTGKRTLHTCQKQPPIEVLLDCNWALSAETLHLEDVLHTVKEGLLQPPLAIEPLELMGRILVGVHQSRGKHFDLSTLKRNTDKSNGEPFRQLMLAHKGERSHGTLDPATLLFIFRPLLQYRSRSFNAPSWHPPAHLPPPTPSPP